MKLTYPESCRRPNCKVKKAINDMLIPRGGLFHECVPLQSDGAPQVDEAMTLKEPPDLLTGSGQLKVVFNSHTKWLRTTGAVMHKKSACQHKVHVVATFPSSKVTLTPMIDHQVDHRGRMTWSWTMSWTVLYHI